MGGGGIDFPDGKICKLTFMTRSMFANYRQWKLTDLTRITSDPTAVTTPHVPHKSYSKDKMLSQCHFHSCFTICLSSPLRRGGRKDGSNHNQNQGQPVLTLPPSERRPNQLAFKPVKSASELASLATSLTLYSQLLDNDSLHYCEEGKKERILNVSFQSQQTASHLCKRCTWWAARMVPACSARRRQVTK